MLVTFSYIRGVELVLLYKSRFVACFLHGENFAIILLISIYTGEVKELQRVKRNFAVASVELKSQLFCYGFNF